MDFNGRMVCGWNVIGGAAFVICYQAAFCSEIFICYYTGSVSDFGCLLEKMHFRRIWAVLLIGAILWNNIPLFFNTYQGERSLNQNTAIFLDQVQPEKSEKIYTNNTHLGWSLLEYYYPENPRAYIGEITDIINEDYENSWLYWTAPLSEEAYAVLEDAGYCVLKKFEGTFANGVYYYAYVVQKASG